MKIKFDIQFEEEDGRRRRVALTSDVTEDRDTEILMEEAARAINKILFVPPDV